MLLAKLIAQNPGGLCAAPSDGSRRLLVAQQRTLGPVVADDAESLAELVTAWLALPGSIRRGSTFLPRARTSTHCDRLGFEMRRELRHMRRGIDALPGRRGAIAAQVSLGEG